MKRPDPTEAEIRAACREIQQTWSDRERLSRMRVDWRPSYRRCDGVREDISAGAYDEHIESHEELIQEGDPVT